MMNPKATASSERTASPYFQTTRWSIVTLANGNSSQPARDALEQLFRTYWPALHGYACRIGYSSHDAEDLTQGFFAEFFHKDYLKAADRTRGKFRSFLLTCFKHYLSHARERQRAERRGGRYQFVSWEAVQHESTADPASSCMSPELAFDRQWALTLLQRAMARLKTEYSRAGHSDHFEQLKQFLCSEGTAAAYQKVGQSLRLSQNAVAVWVHRLRHRYARIVREEIADTVADPNSVTEEMTYLLKLIRS